jgi:formylglycine-generating enzyme required for sulfatase activity
MSGNVWEWCQNKYDEPDQIDVDDSGDMRALRGGSWGYDRDFARAAYRYFFYPFNRNFFFGFRVVCVVPHLKGR